MGDKYRIEVTTKSGERIVVEGFTPSGTEYLLSMALKALAPYTVPTCPGCRACK